MTDKEKYQEQKLAKLDRRRKLNSINFLKTDINRKLVFGISTESGFETITEDKRIDLLRQLEALEINEAKIRGNKFNSQFYSFEPSRSYNFKR
jgi:hypothetical protein